MAGLNRRHFLSGAIASMGIAALYGVAGRIRPGHGFCQAATHRHPPSFRTAGLGR